MSDRERAYSILPPTIHTHTNTRPQTHMYTDIHPPTYICATYYDTTPQHKEFLLNDM